MLSPASLYQTGAEAIQHEQYNQAIQALEAFCEQSSDRQSKPYFQAKVWLVKAYKATNQLEAAIALCQQLATYDNPKIQSWATHVLSTLQPVAIPQSETGNADIPKASAAPDHSRSAPQFVLKEEAELSPDQLAKLLDRGNSLLKYRRFTEAVEVLEEFCLGATETTKNYHQGQMLLVKAYRGNGQQDEAIARCRQLAVSEHSTTKLWAQKYLEVLAPEPIAAETESEIESGISSNNISPNVKDSRSAALSASPGSFSEYPTSPDFARPDSHREEEMDLSQPILSVACHASTWMFWGLWTILIPISVLLFSKNPVIRGNAISALKKIVWIWLSALILLILVLLFAIAGPLLLLPLLALIVVAIADLVLPLIAIIYCIQNPRKVFHYPFIDRVW